MSKPLENGVRLQFLPGMGVAFDADAFDTAIRSQGVRFVHFRAMRCPVGMIDQYDERRPHDDHSGCSNGFLYRKAGIVTALFVNSGSKLDQQDIGLLDGSTVQVTVPRYYDDTGGEVQITNYDRFYLDEQAIVVPTWQLAETHITGRDKLNFPVVTVTDLVDASGKEYGVGDFTVDGAGQIVWSPSGPGFNVDVNKGTIYSVRYLYRPYYYVQRIIHEVRVCQVETLIERSIMRMPQEFVLQREYVAEKENNDELAPDPNSARQVKGPREGVFGPR